ncbi:MAG: dihydroorotase [Bacillota bacterium]
MERVLIKSGHIIDPANDTDGVRDLLIEGGVIAATGDSLAAEGAEVIDAAGCIVTPGFIDIHTHLRQPGQEYKEDIASGTRAAARGGYTALVSLANTDPVIDDEVGIRFIADAARREGAVRVYPVGSVTRGQKGKELAEMGIMVEAGARAFSDDGHPISSGRVMQLALQYSGMFDVPVCVHEEDRSISGGGVVNWGRISAIMGLPGIPAAAESAMIARDLDLCRAFGGHLHIMHVSTARSIELIREARASGLHVTCEAAPHHLALTEDLVRESEYDTNTKVNPPLRTEGDRQALVYALNEGIIDAIATDHAPHSFDDKDTEYIYAEFGISGLETAFSLLHDRLVRRGEVSLGRLIEALTASPASIFDLPGGSLGAGEPADVTILQTDRQWAVNPAEFASKGRNTPLAGWSLTGFVDTVLVGGRAVLRDGVLTC